MARILVVEDDEHTLALLQIMLRYSGYGVQNATNVAEALHVLAHEDLPHLIILDLMLPGVDGITLCKLIRSDSATYQIPILILTARADPVTMQDGLQAGADAYVTKPVLQGELLAKIKELLSEQHGGALALS